MANSLIGGGAASEAAPQTAKDTRVWMYRGQDAKLFDRPEDVPAGEGWKDCPGDDAQKAAPTEAKKPKIKLPVKEAEADGDSDGN